MSSYATVGSVYKCEVSTNLDIKSPEDAVINAVSGTHLSGKTNDDVLAFHAYNKVIEYFPKGLERFFKNLKAIRMLNGKFKQISQSDIKPFPSLVYLDANSNNIEILEDGLFDNHPNMQLVWFGGNKIFHVGKNIFNNMNKITYLSFQSNPCIDMYTQGNSTAAKIIIESLKTKCFDVNFANFSQNLSNLENESKTLTFYTFPIWSENLENLENYFKSSKFSYLSSIKERLQALLNLKESKTCFASNAGNFEGLLTNALSKTENNLKNSLTSTCSANGDKFQSLNEKISKVDQNILKIDGKVTNFDQKCSNFPQITEKIVSLEKKFIVQESGIKNTNQEVLNLGKEVAKLSVNQKDIWNDISKLDEGMSTLLEKSSTESDKIEKNHYDLEDKISGLDGKISNIEDKFSRFEEKLEQKLLDIENKLDKMFKSMRNY